MKGLIEVFEHTDEGISEIYNNGKWLISIKNWREANSVEEISCLEIQYITDQQFALISGKACRLLAPEGMDDTTKIQVLPLEAGMIYNLPVRSWFNNVLSKNCKFMYSESSDAADNSVYRPMSVQQIEQMRKEVCFR